MSKVINTTRVDGDEVITVRNLVDHDVSYFTADGVRRLFQPKAVMEVTASELRQLSYDYGGSVLLTEYLCVENEDLAREFGVEDDTPEYHWTEEDIDNALTDAPIEVLEDALDFAPEGIKNELVQRAVELEIPDMTRREAILKATGRDVTNMIDNKHIIEADEEEKPKPKKRRRTSSTKKKTTKSKRRTSTSDESD